MTTRVPSLFVLAVALLWGGSTGVPMAAAHTETDVVAVPAGSQATVTLRPTHGCGDSPTVEVSVRAPVSGATATAVAGWSAGATADGQGNTVLTWSGGSLPPDQTGAFPVRFDAPNQVGRLLVFPAVQTCANGDELSWISGDPNDDFPAPRLLILAAGSPPAETIDDVPADAPGRDQLTAVIDLDASTTTTTEATTTSTTEATTTTTEAPTTTEATTTTMPAAEQGTDEGSSGSGGNTLLLVLAVGALVAAAAIGGALWARSRNEDDDVTDPRDGHEPPPPAPGTGPDRRP